MISKEVGTNYRLRRERIQGGELFDVAAQRLRTAFVRWNSGHTAFRFHVLLSTFAKIWWKISLLEITGRLRNRQRSSSENRQRKGTPSLYSKLWPYFSRFHVPSTFIRGEKCPTIQGDWEIGNDRGKSATKGYFSLYSLDAVSRPEYFHKGWKIPYYTGRLRNRQAIEENRQPKGTFIVLIGRGFTSRVLS